MTIKYLTQLVIHKGGAIVNSNTCTVEEIEHARKIGMIAVFKDYQFVYKDALWLKNAQDLIKKQIDEERFNRSKSSSYFAER